MQKNKVTALIDISDFNNHFIETLLYANIYEKSNDQCIVLDLNNQSNNKYIDKETRYKKEGDLSTFKLFDRSLYHFVADSNLKQNKVLNFITSTKDKNQNLLVSLSQNQNNLNKSVFEKIDELIIFADINKDLSNTLVKYFINNDIKNKIIKLVIYNYQSNINNEKELLSIRKITKGFKVSIETIDKIKQYNSLQEIANVDPWDEIYKIIKKII